MRGRKTALLTVLLVTSLFLTPLSATELELSRNTEPSFKVGVVMTEPEEIRPGEEFLRVKVWIENLDPERTYRGVAVELKPRFPFSARGSMEKFLGDFGPHRSSIVEFVLEVSDKAYEGEYKLPLMLNFSDTFGMEYSLRKDIELRVDGFPKVDLLKYRLFGTPRPGSEVTIQLDLINRGTGKARNLEVRVGIESASIRRETTSHQRSFRKSKRTQYSEEVHSITEQITKSPPTLFTQQRQFPIVEELPLGLLEEDSKKFLGVLYPLDKRRVTFNVIISGDAKSGVYHIPVEMRYMDEDEIIVEETSISIEVSGEPELEIIPREYPREVSPGDEFSLKVDVINRGETDAKYVLLMLESNQTDSISPEEVYIGTLEPDDFDTVEFDISLKEELIGKEVILLLRAHYKDFNNMDKLYEEELKLELAKPEYLRKAKRKEKEGLIRRILDWIFG